MEVKRGDVLIAVVPGDLGRPRPGIVVQADPFNKILLTILFCPITSDIQEDLPLRPILEAKSSNGLVLRSQIMTDKMIALKRSHARRVIGRIDQRTSDQLDRALLVVLGLAR